jgi:hypothetical protein
VRYSVRAFLARPDAPNRIHDPEYARSVGFRGGLIPGVDVWGYMSRLPVERWGVDWLERGSGFCRFLRPVVEGDEVVVSWPSGLEARVDDEVCAVGEAALPDAAPEAVDLDAFPARPLPAAPPAASPAAFEAADEILGTVRQVVDEGTARVQLDEVLERLPVYEEQRLVHPAHLLRFANSALSENFSLGPWMHVSSRIAHLGLVRWGAAVEARPRLVRHWEHKGHRFVELDVLILGDGRPAARIDHTSIYEPAFLRGD